MDPNASFSSTSSMKALGSLATNNTGSSSANQNLKAIQDQLAALKMQKSQLGTTVHIETATTTVSSDLWQ